MSMQVFLNLLYTFAILLLSGSVIHLDYKMRKMRKQMIAIESMNKTLLLMHGSITSQSDALNSLMNVVTLLNASIQKNHPE